MKYSDAIARAFRALRSGGLWSFAITATASMFAVVAVIAAGAYFVAGPRADALLGALPSSTGGAPVGVGRALAGSAGLLVGLLVAIPLALIYHGGMVHLSDDAIAGRPTHLGSGWSFGARRMGRTFVVDFVVGAVMLVAILVGMLPLIIGVVAVAAASSDSNGIAALGGICFGYLLFLVVIVVTSLVVSAWESLSIRYALIGERTSGDALSCGWRAFRARWKNVVLFALIALGMQYGYSFVTSIVLVPIELLTMPHAFFPAASPPDPTQIFPEMLHAYAIILPLSMLLYLPWLVFFHNLWTAFFRQMTGLDIPPQPAPLAYAPYPRTPAETPAEPWPPAEPPAEQPPAAPAPPPSAAEGPPMAPTDEGPRA